MLQKSNLHFTANQTKLPPKMLPTPRMRKLLENCTPQPQTLLSPKCAQCVPNTENDRDGVEALCGSGGVVVSTWVVNKADIYVMVLLAICLPCLL